MLSLPSQSTEREEELELVAAGQLIIPKRPFDIESFWEIGWDIRTPKVNRTVFQKAIAAAREDLDVNGVQT
jgi:hypothetical protein